VFVSPTATLTALGRLPRRRQVPFLCSAKEKGRKERPPNCRALLLRSAALGPSRDDSASCLTVPSRASLHAPLRASSQSLAVLGRDRRGLNVNSGSVDWASHCSAQSTSYFNCETRISQLPSPAVQKMPQVLQVTYETGTQTGKDYQHQALQPVLQKNSNTPSIHPISMHAALFCVLDTLILPTALDT